MCINWEKLLDLNKNHVDYYMGSFLHILTEKIKKQAPIKSICSKTLTLNDKPWISRAIRKSIKICNKIYKQNR